MNKPWIAALGSLLLAAAPGTYAGVGAGDFEAGVGISLSHSTTSIDYNGTTTDTTSNTGTIGGNVGWFATDMIELKAAATGTRSSSGGTTTTLGVISPGADFVFLGKSGKVAPFVGAAYGKSFGTTVPGSVDTNYVDGHAGVKFFITERATLEVKATYFKPTDSAADARFDLAAGINVYF